MSEQIDIDINVNTNNIDEIDELSSKLDEANSSANDLSDSLSDMETSISVDTGDLEDANAEAEEVVTELEEIDNTTVEPTLEMDSSNIDEANEKLEETESSASSLTTALGGTVGVVGFEKMVETADKINTSWNQLKLTFGGTSSSLKDLETKTNQAAEATGRSGSSVRGYFNNMGIAGIKNTDLLTSSFQSLAGKAYQTGQDIEGMESKVQKMVMTGNASDRMLTTLGITTADLGRAMGVTGEEAKSAFEQLNPEERLSAISKAMGDGKQANDMYKNSYEGLKTQAETSMAGLMGAIGQGVLPVINPMIQGATGLIKGFTGTFKSLPGPVQGVVGSLGGFLAVGTAAIGALGLIGQVGSGVVGGLRSMKSAYDGVRSAMGTARAMMDALRNSESITEGVRAALAIATGAETTAETASTAAKTAAIGPTTGLSIATNSLLWPLLLIVGAVIAVIAVMWYLYNTNETVRNGINWLVAQIQGFIAMLMPVVQAIVSFVTKIGSNLGKLPNLVWTIFLKVIAFVAQFAITFVQRGIQAAHNFINSVRSALAGIGGAISSALSGVFNFITAPFKKAFDWVNNTVIKPLKGAWDWLSSAFSGFSGYGDFNETGFSGMDTINTAIAGMTNNSNYSSMNVNNNFYGLIEESAADYIVGAVNDRLRREKLLKGD